MKPNKIVSAICLLSAIGLSDDAVNAAAEEKIRKPAVAGSWYPSSAGKLRDLLTTLTDKAKKTRVLLPENRSLKALILPHASPYASGWTAAHASFALKSTRYSKIVLIGPDHRVGFHNGSISRAEGFQTPLGTVRLHRDAAALRHESSLFKHYPASDRNEHSLETVLIFLQHYLTDFRLVPIVVGHPSDVAQISAALEAIIDLDTLVVVSSDLSHFLPYQQAVTKDRQTISRILQLDSESLSKCSGCACGRIPILVLIDLAKRHQWVPVLMHYSNSGDTVGGRNQVVGYTAIAFYGGGDMKTDPILNHSFDPTEGQQLIKLARCAIAEHLGVATDDLDVDTHPTAFDDQCYQMHCGTFVTLEKSGQLRGCIGNLSSDRSIVEGIKENALNAAFKDPRFPPLTAEEFNQVKISISILTEPKRLEHKGGDDLLARLRVNVDGVIIRQGPHSATFLPQVWEQLPQPKLFLSHLCMKAALPADAWQSSNLEVSTYQVQYFEEP